MSCPALVLTSVAASLSACSSASEETAPTDTTAAIASPYCSDLAELTTVIDEGGTSGRYHRLMQQVIDESPPEHTEAWSLMLTLSLEQFTYENFNAAMNSLDDILADLEQRCPRLGRFIVDDDGHVRGFPPVDDSSGEVTPSVWSTQVDHAPDADEGAESPAVEPALAGLQRIANAFSDHDHSTGLDECPLATFSEIVAGTPAARQDTDDTVIEPLVESDWEAVFEPTSDAVYCRYPGAGFAIRAEPIGTSDIDVALEPRHGGAAVMGEQLEVLGGVMRPYYVEASRDGVPIGAWSVAWARDGIMLLLVTQYDARWAPDAAPDIAIEWMQSLAPAIIENLATVEADALAPA